jgi:hypothetical protein
MLEQLTNLLNMLTPISPILMPSMWIGVAAYAIWYFGSAKNYAPLTVEEIRVLWKIHKQDTKCSSGRWEKIRKGRKVIGFKCGCGYRHVQKRPLV